ncbi:MAG: L,D-transpeptidase family protein [Proteobacteria bacterium]|nr:L,D-transpeptidase family protein [Pseudomonadota bacterium]
MARIGTALFSLVLLLVAAPGLAEDEVGWSNINEKGFELVVRKADRRMEVVSPPGPDGHIVRSYRIGLGFAPEGDKERQGDGKTPEGSFTITRLIPKSQYYKAFLINYPDPADAARGLEAGIIDAATKKKIDDAHTKGSTPPQYSDLGGLIEIHGMGGSSDWTLGCVAADNAVIDELWPHTKVGTKVRILP